MLHIIRFNFKTPLHIGNVREEYDVSEPTLHSDALYAAMMQAWSVLGMHDRIPKSETDGINFCTSSLFPFSTDLTTKEPVYFFPKPYGLLNESEAIKNPERDIKKLKKLQYYDSEFFNYFLGRTEIKDDYTDAVKGKYLTRANIDGNFMKSEVYTRVVVPRFTGVVEEKADTLPYHVERIFFSTGSGIFCLCWFADENARKDVEAALRFLGDEGIGTDRHVGNGMFEYTIEEARLFKNLSKSNYWLNLSLFCPENQETLSEMLDENSRYEITKRGGWITNPPFATYRKKSIWMFREGSIFKMPATATTIANNGIKLKTAGKMANLRPDIMKGDGHPVWRLGKSLFVPVNI